jgi:hypothetical protein
MKHVEGYVYSFRSFFFRSKQQSFCKQHVVDHISADSGLAHVVIPFFFCITWYSSWFKCWVILDESGVCVKKLRPGFWRLQWTYLLRMWIQFEPHRERGSFTPHCNSFVEIILFYFENNSCHVNRRFVPQQLSRIRVAGFPDGRHQRTKSCLHGYLPAAPALKAYKSLRVHHAFSRRQPCRIKVPRVQRAILVTVVLDLFSL